MSSGEKILYKHIETIRRCFIMSVGKSKGFVRVPRSSEGVEHLDAGAEIR